MNNRRPKICIVATVPFALRVFMRAHILKLADEYDVTLVTSGRNVDVHDLLGENVIAEHLQICRQISIFNDLRALVGLYRLFRKNHFQLVQSLMPKSGLLAMLAARLAGVPYRVHIFTGQVWANKTGLSRVILKLMDKIISICSTNLLTDSFSQRNYLIAQKIVMPHKVSVLANGSVCGVDVERFTYNPQAREQLRRDLRIPEDALVFIFLGRVNHEKGVLDLVQAFVAMNQQFPNSHLLIVGPDENNLDEKLQEMAASCRAHYSRIGYTDRPEEYMSCGDIFCLPSYREGFGSVIIEAASIGLPSVASRIYGLTDAVEAGVTGILHQPGNIRQIQEALTLLAKNSALRKKLGAEARQRAHHMFDQSLVAQAMRDFYQKLFS